MNGRAIAGQPLLAVRLVIGLAQGLVLYLLYRASEGHVWPATNGLIFAPVLLVFLYVPILLSLSLGEVTWQRAAHWAAAAGIAGAALSFFDNWSAWPVEWIGDKAQPHIFNSVHFYFAGGAALFIAHALVMGGLADRRFVASYPTHFDVAWKLAVQLALAALFAGIFWLLLELGAGLFRLIKLDFFDKLIRHEWFWIPATTLAVAGALHLTDVRPALVRGARTLLLSLLSWLLPLIALIVAGFLVSLPFTGLAPLWSFGHASGLLLVTCAVLILLINAAHQDGDPEHLPPAILRWAGTAAALLPVPLSLLAGYALFLRVQQYGWTLDRVTVAAIVLIAASYAGGYAFAALMRGAWLARIEQWNFRVALLSLAIVVALYSPIASPARISVADQVARLESGKITPDKFDFEYLRWYGGRYGQAALTRLSQNGSQEVRPLANAALRSKFRFAPRAQPDAQHLTVYPRGRSLPPSFARFWTEYSAGPEASLCKGNLDCDAFLVDLDGDGTEEILMVDLADDLVIYSPSGDHWSNVGEIVTPAECPGILAALRQGRYTTIPPVRHWKDVRIGGLTLKTKPHNESGRIDCPSELAK
jgi:hypothetical protein